ncbi:MAG: hypothetical protein LBN07_00350 [Christensenellaceae bacterium]|jgi:ABC-type transport system involved in multi-copper enzyme maturation permease subunit|nr:hypothetical protein [Christensenellaceae bacterium]
MKACLKKETLEVLRTGKFWIYMGAGIGMALMSVMLFFMMKVVSSFEVAAEQMAGMMVMFEMTYANSVMYFMTIMGTYFVILAIIMTMRVVSKELQDKKWTLPICSGVKPSHMIASKLIVNTAAIVLAFIAASLFHMIITIIFFTANITVWDMLYYYAMLLVFIIFITTFTISLNAIIKKGWLTALISILTLIFVSNIFGMIPIGSSTLSNFSPFLFLDQLQNGVALVVAKNTWYEYLSAGLSTFVLMALLIFFAIKSSKVAAQNLK